MNTSWITKLVLLGTLSKAALASASTVMLAWDPSSATNIASYNLYYGASSRVYTNLMAVGNATNATVSGLNPGTTYYFAATAVDTFGLESQYSTEIVYTVPGNLGTVTLTNLAQTYDGTAKNAGATTVPAGLQVALTYNGSPTAPTNAGSYTVVGKITDPNYTGAATNTLVIAKGRVTVTLSGLNQTYDGTGKIAQATSSPAGLAINLTYNGLASPPTNAGNYTVVGLVNDPNRTGGATNTLVVAKGQATISFSGLNQNYNGSARTVLATSSPAGLSISLTYNGSPNAPTNVGSYTVVGLINDPNRIGGATNTLAVAKGQALITLAGLAQIYDGNAKVVQAASTPPGLQINLTYDGAGNAPTNAGMYLVVGTVSDLNYTGAVTNTLVVAKGQALVTLTGLAQTYDGTGKTIQASCIPAGLQVNVTCNGWSWAPTNAGNYTMVGTVNDPNYSGAATNTLVVAKAQAAVALTGLSQTYDGTPKSVQGSSAPAGLLLNFTYNGLSSAPTNAGSYTVVGTINDVNYTGIATNTLIIAQGQATITFTGLNQVFDGTARTVQATSSPAGLSISLTYNGAPNAPTNVGSYTVVGLINDPNRIGGATNTLVVANGQAIIALTGLTQTYDGTAKAVRATSTPAGLQINLTYNGAGNAPTNAGTYVVVGRVSDLNYAGAVTNTLVVNKGQAIVTLNGLSQTYDGTAKIIQASSTPAGLQVNFTCNGWSWAPTNAGNYTMVGTVNDPNYSGAATNTLVIAKATAGITLGNLVQVFNGTPRYVTVTTTPANLAVNVTYNGLAQAPTRVGSYRVIATVTDLNYQGAATNSLTITKQRQHVGVVASSQAIEVPPAPSASITIAWSPNTNTVFLYESSDLVNWNVLTSANGQDGQLILSPEPGAHYFRAVAKGSAGSCDLPLTIGRQ